MDAWTTSTTPNWTAAERESFFAAVARHRRAAWRVTVASAVANILFALVVAILMSPLFYALIALVFDVVNLVHQTPNVVKFIAQVLDPLFSQGKQPAPLREWVHVGFLAALPGVIWMGLVLLMLRRLLRISGAFTGVDVPSRAPQVQVLAEQRFANVVQEMALAAGLPTPNVRIVEDERVNAVVFGADEQHVTLLASTGLLARCSRDQLQGVAAHLVSSIADGDMSIGVRAATTLSLFAFMARFSGLLVETDRGTMLVRTAVTMLRPTPESARALTVELADPMRNRQAKRADVEHTAKSQSGERSWRDNIWLPLTGPIVITGFLSGLVQMVVLAPLVALAWRQRKYMADATSVRLTRDPDAVAGALQVLNSADTAASFASWAQHLAVVSPGTGLRGPLGRSIVSMYPMVGNRLLALQRMGAHVSYQPRHLPFWVYLVGVPLGAIIGSLLAVVVVGLAYVSIPLSALFLGIPFGIVHMLLRSHGG